MKAIRVHQFGEPDVLTLEDVPAPAAGPGQVVVRAAAIGVNPVDTYIRAGKYGPRPFPFVPGTDVGGTIDSVGPGVGQWKPGDRVYTASTLSGAYAELALCDATKVFRLPDKVGFAEGAALGVPAATAYKAVFMRGQAKPAEDVLVHGASGSVGLFCVQMLRAIGCTVYGTGGSDAGRAGVAREGAHRVLDHKAPGYLDELSKLTGGKGVELIVEMLANVNLDKDLGALAKYGRVVVVGSRGRVEIDPRGTMARDADVRGMTLMNVTDAELRAIHAALAAMLDAGTLRPVVAKRLPLAEAARAHREVLGAGAVGKIVLEP